ncbi:MAG TPA: NADPH:quinone reductase [Streptosporangiaceae bacterium]|nr:NADPH:quinone reductase [Streptosporangiaceae bacterium]
MRAALYRAPGPAAESLRVEDVDRPDPGPGEVRVRMQLSGVNPTDWKSRSGATPRPIDGFQVPHHDGTGIIDAVGPGVAVGRVGERVWTWLAAAGNRWGTAAEWSVLPARQAVPLPGSASAELGASLGVPAMTAHRALVADGPIDGANVLVAGGAGAVGHYAIELAKFFGARVAATVSGPAKAELARHAGADLVVNYRDAGAADQLREFAPQMDRIVELALGANLDLDLALSGPGTHIVDYAAEAADPVLPVRRCMTANVTIRFILLYGVPAEAADQAVADISRALAAGALTELPVTRFPLEQIAAAHDAVAAGTVGKVLVELA